MALASMAGAETVDFDINRDDNNVSFNLDDATVLTLSYTNWTYNGGGSNSVGSWQTPEHEAYQNSFSPDAQLRDGVGTQELPDSWTMNFTVTNNTDAVITLTQFTFDTYSYFGGGKDRDSAVQVTLTLGQVTTERFDLGYKGDTAEAVLNLTGADAITIGAKQTVSLALIMNGSDPNNTYTGIKSGSVTYSVVPEPTTASLSLLALAGLAARRRRH